MADLGQIGCSAGAPSIAFSYSLTGLVYDANGDPTRHRVCAYERTSGLFSGGTFSDATTGAFTLFTNILFGDSEHFVVEFDPARENNARIFDFVSPL